MAASLKSYPTNERQHMKTTGVFITKEEAVEILASALSYCQQAGLAVMAHHNEAGALVLTLPEVAYTVENDQAVFRVMGDGTLPGSDGTYPPE